MNNCIVWPGRVGAEGYVSVWLDGRPQLAHRLVYEQRYGPILAGLHIDHVCRNRACLNPEHMEAVTPKENVLRGVGPSAVNRRKTHCSKGHAFDAANTFYYRATSGGLGRGCRICRRDAGRRWKMKRAA